MTSIVVQFPRWIQITLGGNPDTKLIWRKSASLVTIRNPLFLA